MHILVITGASGAGKTAAVRAFDARRASGVRCFYFDSIGVPSAAAMEREYGSGERWQAWATKEWLARLGALPADVRVAILDGQVLPSFILDAAPVARSREVHIVLLDCSPEARHARLRGPRQQPELASSVMDRWAAYLRGQADALHIPVIDTTALTIDQVADRIDALARPLLDSGPPSA